MGWKEVKLWKVTHWTLAMPVHKWCEDPEWMLIEALSARDARNIFKSYIIKHPKDFIGDELGFMAWCSRLGRKPNVRMEKEYFKLMLSWGKEYPPEIRYRHLIEAAVFKKIIRITHAKVGY